jgi:mRNA-degrading endonuclease RelE of RelBE toxin-antitoxin system
MNLIVPPVIVKALRLVSVRDRQALLRKARIFAGDPFGRYAWARTLKGQPNVVRIRQGDWRMVCRIDREEQTVIVDAVAHRREIYR